MICSNPEVRKLEARRTGDRNKTRENNSVI